MNIVVLDGFTLNPGDLSWDPLKDIGNCTIYDRTDPGLVLDRAKDADIILTNKTVLTADLIENLPNLKYIGVLATGYNVVDLNAAANRNIPVTNVPAYSTRAVAQMTFAHILNLTHHVADHAGPIRDGKWSRSPDFAYWDYPPIELTDLTIGIVGLGRIGRAVAELAKQFAMKILAYDIAVPTEPPEDITFTDLETLFKKSDIVTLHCPLTDQNKHFVSKDLLSLMKNTAFLINCARGPLIDARALADALNSDQIAGAGLDVLDTEPPPPDNPLLTAKNCFITPHIAWATKTARQRLLNTVVENIKAFLNKKPKNVVNDFV